MRGVHPNSRGNNVLAHEKQKRLRGCFMDGASIRAAARLVGCSPNAANGYLQRLRGDLRDPDAPNHPVAAASVATVSDLIAREPLYFNGLPLNNGLVWSEADKAVVRTLCVNGKDPKACAEVLGRKAKAVAWQAEHMGLRLPSSWTHLLGRLGKSRVVAPAILQWPYRENWAGMTGEDLMSLVSREIAGRVPRAFVADVGQEMVVDLLTQRLQADELRAAIPRYLSKVRRALQPWQERSLGGFSRGSDGEDAGETAVMDWLTYDGRNYEDMLIEQLEPE